MNSSDNSIYSNWIAYPGYNNGAYNGISSGWSKIYYSSNWTSRHQDKDDWCLCVLNSNIGSQVGWYGVASYASNSDLNNLSVKALGYPLIPGSTLYQYYTNGNLSNISSQKFDTSSKISEGMSGGPIIRTSDNYAVGIVKGYYTFRPDTGIGVRTTADIVDLIIELRG